MPDILPTPVEGTVVRAAGGIWRPIDPTGLPVPAAAASTAVADLGATVGEANNAASATLVATKAEHDATRSTINALLASLRASGLLRP